MKWENAETNEDGVLTEELIADGAIVGYVQQFPANAPTTYAHAMGHRLGAFESLEVAKAAAERRASNWSH